MKLRNLITFLEKIAPPIYQEDYDNCGLIVGQIDADITGVITCLDVTEEVLKEALHYRCNVVVAHHPIVFKGLKKLTGQTYVERVLLQAIKHDIAIYAIHTNLDNMYHRGVNSKIAEKLGLQNTVILLPKKATKKLNIWIPAAHSENLKKALLGVVEDLPQASSLTIFSGLSINNNQQEAFIEIELLYALDLESHLLQVVKSMQLHTPLTYHTSETNNLTLSIGAGMIGDLPTAMPENEFLAFLKSQMQTACVRHTQYLGKEIRKVAVCGGAGGFLLSQAIRQGADIFITSDYKYHEFFDADGKIMIADIGHYESEQFTADLLSSWISQKFSTFDVRSTTVCTNPVHYY